MWIRDWMEIKQVSITELKPCKYNPRVISDYEKDKLKKSIKAFGLVQPLIVNKDYEIIGGNQRFEAMKELGFKTVDIIILDLKKKDEIALNIALNKISGDWNNEILKGLLSELDTSHLDLTGFSEAELNNFNFSFEDLELMTEELKEKRVNYIEWKAKITKKDWEVIDKMLRSIKRKNKLENMSSEVFNGKLLFYLCKNGSPSG